MCCNPLSPITVNTVARTVVCSNITRKNIRFQNTGISIIFLKAQYARKDYIHCLLHCSCFGSCQ